MTNEIIEQRIKWACGRKLKFNMEEAAQKFGGKPSDVLIYLCSNCNYLHFGHKPNWELTPNELAVKRRAKEAAERRKRLIAQANDLGGFLARPAGQRNNQSARQGYPRWVPLSAAAKKQ